MIDTDKTVTCDLCKAQIVCVGTKATWYDAMDPDSTKWAFMCPTCFKAAGAALGPGVGQKFGVGPGKKWVKVAG